MHFSKRGGHCRLESNKGTKSEGRNLNAQSTDIAPFNTCSNHREHIVTKNHLLSVLSGRAFLAAARMHCNV